MKEHYAECLTRSVENFYFIAKTLVNDLTIDKLTNALVYLYTAEHPCLITMQDIVHIATWKIFNWFVYKVWLYSHSRLNIGLYQVYAKSVTKLYRYHVAASTRSQFKEMHIVILVKQNLNVHLAEANSECSDNTL